MSPRHTSGDGTKERILDAAERLFSEDGFDATSLRAVTAAAGTNLAAVNYHFGSKAALLPAVAARILEPVTIRQLELLDELEAADRDPSVEDLLEAFISPILDLFEQGGGRGPVLARLMGRIISDPGRQMQRIVIERVRESQRRYEEAFALALPDLPADERRFRFASIRAVVISHQVRLHAGIEPYARALTGPAGRRAVRAWTLAFLSAAMRAPATVIASAPQTPAPPPAPVVQARRRG
jgi:AcrR family transcriptional regulator